MHHNALVGADGNQGVPFLIELIGTGTIIPELYPLSELVRHEVVLGAVDIVECAISIRIVLLKEGQPLAVDFRYVRPGCRVVQEGPVFAVDAKSVSLAVV